MKKSTRNTLLVIEVILDIIGLIFLIQWYIHQRKANSEENEIDESDTLEEEKEVTTEHTPLGRKYITLENRRRD